MFGCISTAVQEATQMYDKGINPKMLVQEQFDRIASSKILLMPCLQQAVEMKQMQ